MQHPSRRQVLAGLAGVAGALVLPGCGGASTTAPTTTTASDGFTLGARFADGYRAPAVLAAGTRQRAPFILKGDDGWPVVDGAPDAIAVTVTRDGSVVHEGSIDRHGEPGVTPYYPLVFTPEASGDFEMSGVDLGDPYPFRVVERSASHLVQVGDPMRAVDTPTADDPGGVDPICTRFREACPFHDMTLTEALATDGPTALLVSTPRYCQTDVCGPALEVLMSLAPGIAGLTTVHAEPWMNEDLKELTPVIGAYALDFEPSLVVADADGVIRDILHFCMDTRETRQALRRATA
ncbi:MAG: twin-arginine translocation signal domain-containing protein [Acidimicrobiales bacterium]|mgnify:CR=1 FL=1|jgi:hypothetical protein|nr:twin-arginine translocation signal domain-containing protein [Acidimicrobiales bacterium]|tara:strand:+ start:4390 stop:5268 length:879 start_codon:yes stop_codon:yes gene_type:complete